MKISLITDEISADPETAIELGVEWGIRDFELRGFFTDRVPVLTGHQKQRLHDALDQYQARFIAIGPGLFKCPYPPMQAPRSPLGWMDRGAYDGWKESQNMLARHMQELLPASLDFACEFGAPLLVIFGFDRDGTTAGAPPEPVIRALRQAAERAASSGVKLVLENEEGFWADTGARTAQAIRAVDHPALGINWDPGNALCSGDEPYPRGYEPVRGLVKHVHFKDARRSPDGACEYATQGEVDWAGQIRALLADGYEGFVSVETHLRPKVSSARLALERLRELIAAAQGKDRAAPTNQKSARHGQA